MTTPASKSSPRASRDTAGVGTTPAERTRAPPHASPEQKRGEQRWTALARVAPDGDPHGVGQAFAEDARQGRAQPGDRPGVERGSSPPRAESRPCRTGAARDPGRRLVLICPPGRRAAAHQRSRRRSEGKRRPLSLAVPRRAAGSGLRPWSFGPWAGAAPPSSGGRRGVGRRRSGLRSGHPLDVHVDLRLAESGDAAARAGRGIDGGRDLEVVVLGAGLEPARVDLEGDGHRDPRRGAWARARRS